MSSPSLFIIGMGCIINNWFAGWLCTNLGIAQHVWVAGVVPAFVVYHMCDKSRLKNAASALVRFPADWRTLFYILSVGLITLVNVYFEFVSWVILALQGCLYFLIMAFSLEKTMYIGDCCGTIGKKVFRWVMMKFICEVAWMKMKGEWSFCSPYSRDLVVVSTDRYYILKKSPLPSIEETSSQEAEEFTFNFPIEECEVVGKYEYLQSYSNGIDRRKQPNKFEVSLLFKKDKTCLEEYTYFTVPPKRVARIKRVLEILKTKGNVVLSNFHRNMGSELNSAHARCYEFEEMLNLVLAEGWALEKVNLEAQYECSISGSSFERGTASGFLLGLACCLICSLCKLSPGASASVFAVAILFVAQMELDILRLLTKSQRGIQVMPSSILLSRLLTICRAGLSSGDFLY